MKILVGLSGGLDSTCTAYLLKKQGHEVIGAAVVMHDYTDISSAEKSAEEVGIPFVLIDKREEFKKEVIAPFCEQYANALTPNPCVFCNPKIKFASLCEYAKKNGFDCVSTGHYADVLCENGRYFIRKGIDASRDQSYVLWALPQEILKMLYFPLANTEKAFLRGLAEEMNFECRKAKESREICFIPSNDHSGFISDYTGKKFPEGDFIDENGKKIGKHKGIINYTVGQRKGLGLAMNGHVFVTEINPENNTVRVTRGEGLFAEKAEINNLAFQKLAPGGRTLEAEVKIRYGAKSVKCDVTISGDKALIEFSEPVRAITPGQSAVFYDGSDLLFGGTFIK